MALHESMTVKAESLPIELSGLEKPSKPVRQGSSLKDLFKQAGNVVHADVMMGDDGRSKGFGTVVMGSTTDAAAAIQLLNEAEHLGRNLIVRPDAHA